MDANDKGETKQLSRDEGAPQIIPLPRCPTCGSSNVKCYCTPNGVSRYKCRENEDHPGFKVIYR